MLDLAALVAESFTSPVALADVSSAKLFAFQSLKADTMGFTFAVSKVMPAGLVTFPS
jgi:hypothetical protein